MGKRNELLRTLSEGSTKHIRLRLDCCVLLKKIFSMIGMHCLYVVMLSYAQDCRSNWTVCLDRLPKMNAVILTVPHLTLCDVKLDSLLLLDDEHCPKKKQWK